MPRSFLMFALLLVAALVPARAQTDPLEGFEDPVAQLNALLPSVPDDERADLILGRALTETTAPPAVIEAMEFIMLLVPGDSEWDAAVAWATEEPQKAALEAFREATDRRGDHVFALPYGEGAPADLFAEGFGVTLNDGKLYDAELGYFDYLDRLNMLVWIEANRLAEAGEGMDAAELLASEVRLGRMLADRPRFEEAFMGYATMLNACESLRDLVYRNRELLSGRDTKRIGRLLEDRTLRLDRLRFPNGGEIAVKQAILDTYERMGDADAQALGGLLEGTDLPVSEDHIGYFEAVEAATRIFADWRLRWNLDPYDLIMDRPSYFTSLLASAESHALIVAVANAHDLLFEMRLRLRAELAGTKLALGVVAYSNDFGAWPKPLVAIRPAYARDIDTDPYDPLQADQMRYFVPIRDQEWGPRETPHPHTIRVHVALDASELVHLAVSPALRHISDKAAVESMRAFTAAITSRGIEPRNLHEKLMAMDEASLMALIPEHMKARAQGLGADGLRNLAYVLVGSTLVTPDFKQLRDAWAQEPLSNDRRSRRRPRRNPNQEVPRELVEAARFFAIALNETGDPLARRLRREVEPDPNYAMFDVTLDESEFVLYSVGRDGNFQWAEDSGADGTDILYWPPLLSLYREHTGG